MGNHSHRKILRAIGHLITNQELFLALGDKRAAVMAEQAATIADMQAQIDKLMQEASDG